MKRNILRISDNPELIPELARWFHGKWGIPTEAYIESMESALKGNAAFPEWYAVMEDSLIVGGAGVIENDFHNRPDLAPNLCALYVEPASRCQGIAGELLGFISIDMHSRGIDTLYLVTDHTSFYERYGWEYYCAVRCSGEDYDSRMYVKKTLRSENEK